jgi:hypothetical protein
MGILCTIVETLFDQRPLSAFSADAIAHHMGAVRLRAPLTASKRTP